MSRVDSEQTHVGVPFERGQLKPRYLKRGLALLATREEGIYLIGDRTTHIRLRSRLELTLVQEMVARNRVPLVTIAPLGRAPLRSDEDALSAERAVDTAFDIEAALDRIGNAGLTSRSQPLPALPPRYGVLPTARDLALQLIIQRSAPELAECEWAQRDSDGGATTLSLRSSARILISGRSRIATLLLQLLPQSGVGVVEFADRYLLPEISPMDIGIGDIGVEDIGSNFYQHHSARAARIALFPASSISKKVDLDRSLEAERIETHQRPTLIIHCGDLGVEDQVDWMVTSQPHLIVTKPIGREVAISPIVLPGQSPCMRCMELYELDRYGFSRFERIPLTQLDESSIVASHFIASLVASIVLNFIDSQILTAQGVGEITYIDRLNLRAPQVVAIERHPLCGCSTSFAQDYPAITMQ
jgi:hypothetical protein